ncbi:MAG: efflux RND transporter periplasmic adaptor subunit [Sphingomonadales bacterium]
MQDVEHKKRVRRRRFWIAAVATTVFVGAAAWLLLVKMPAFVQEMIASMPRPPITVASTQAAVEPWQGRIEAIGTVVAVNGVDVSSEVAGIVEEIHFSSGQEVEAGAPLLRIRDHVERADLKQNQAMLKDAELELERSRSLAQRGNVSQATLDAALARRDQAAAAVERIKALIAQKNLQAPFAGRLGVRLVNIGEFIAAGTPVVTLQALDQVYVNFQVPEQSVARIAVGLPVTIRVDAFPDQSFTGAITSIDSKVEAATRSALVQATFPNPDRHLVPGMFADVSVLVGAPETRITVPETAVSFSLYGDAVFVLTPLPEDPSLFTVARRTIMVADRRAGEVAIARGLEPGEHIVAAGGFKLRAGATVAIDNSVTLQPDQPRPKL